MWRTLRTAVSRIPPGFMNRQTSIEIAGIIISSVTAVIAILLTALTFSHSQKIDLLTNQLEKEKLFADTMANAIEHLSSDDLRRQRLAVVSLSNTAETQQQIIQVVKLIIIASRGNLQGRNVSSISRPQLGVLYELASLDPSKQSKYEKALAEVEVQQLIGNFLPLTGATSPSADINETPDPPITSPQRVPDPESSNELEKQTLNIEIRNLVAKTYARDRSIRRNATAILASDKWRSWDSIIVKELIGTYKRNSDNPFGIVNTLFLLGKMSDDRLTENLGDIKEIVQTARSLLSESNKTKYLTSIERRIASLERT